MSGFADQLNKLLADFQFYYFKLRDFHWSIRGENFFDLYDYSKRLYTEIAEYIDVIAERIMAIGGEPAKDIPTYRSLSDVHPRIEVNSDREMIEHLLEDYNLINKQLKQLIKHASEIQDYTTEIKLKEILANLANDHWKMRNWIETQLQTLSLNDLR